METNEEGLTKEEKVMFSILGIILIVAIGVLIINSFSSNERKLDNKETPITENKGQEETVKDENVTDIEDGSLIEDVPTENTTNNNSVVVNVSNNTSTKPKPTIKPNIPEEDVNGTGSTNIPGIIEWEFKDTMITKAHTNEIITVEKNVLLKDGTEAEAVITIRKLEGNSWNIVDISTGSFQVTEGTYKYYYTYGNQTKELLLVVTNKLEFEKLELLTLTTYNEETIITEEEFNNYKSTLENSKLLLEENKLIVYKVGQKTNLIPVVLTLNEELQEPVLYTSTLGITLSTENQNWYQELTTKDIILWLDLSVMDLENKEINININGTNYYFDLTIEINENVAPEIPPIVDVPSDDENNQEDNQENLDKNEENTNEEIDNSEEVQPELPPEEQTPEETTSIENIEESLENTDNQNSTTIVELETS